MELIPFEAKSFGVNKLVEITPDKFGELVLRMTNFDIVIVNWNTGRKLRACLESISLTRSIADFHLDKCIVVDNASTDESLDNLGGSLLPLEIIENTENKGFAFACNQGARQGKGEYILFLNPDTRLFPETLKEALPFFQRKQNEKVGILGVQLVDEKGIVQRNVARFPTKTSLFYQMLGFDRLWPKRFHSHFMSEWDHLASREVDQVTGAFFLVRRKLFEQIHGFDERFFMYFEDLDFAYRAKKSGWISYYISNVQAMHNGGSASSRVKARRLSYVLKSRVLYVAKHFGVLYALCILLASMGLEFWIRMGWCMINWSWLDLLDTVNGYGMFLKSTPELIVKMGNQ